MADLIGPRDDRTVPGGVAEGGRDLTARAEAPTWARHLTDDDEWVVRTALANVASDLDKALSAMPTDLRSPARKVITESRQRYLDVLDRLDFGPVEKIERV